MMTTPLHSNFTSAFSGKPVPPLLILAIAILLLFGSCGGPGGSAETPPADTGSAAFSIKWHSYEDAADTTTEDVVGQAIADCDQAGVANVQCHAYQEDGIHLTESDLWSCDQRKGTFDGIASGTNRQVICTGLDEDNEIRYLGQARDVTITAGKNTSRAIDAYPFYTRQLLSPPNGSEDVRANRDILTWESVQNAEEYRVQISQTLDFEASAIVEEDTTSRTDYTPSMLLAGANGTHYFWRVKPVINDLEGLPSDVWQFTTVPGENCRRPVFDEIAAWTGLVGQPIQFTVHANDPDGDQITYSLGAGAPADAVINPASGEFTWTPTTNGNFPVIFQATDNSTCEESLSEMTVNITVGTCPQLTFAEIGNQTATVGQPQPLSFTLNTTSDAGVVITCEVVSPTPLPTGATFDATQRTFTWTPQAGQEGLHTIRFRASVACQDNTLSTIEQDVNITVAAAAACQAPVLRPINHIWLEFLDVQPVQISAEDADTPSANLTFTTTRLTTDRPGPSCVLTPNNDGTATYSCQLADGDDWGPVEQNFRVCDNCTQPGPQCDEETVQVVGFIGRQYLTSHTWSNREATSSGPMVIQMRSDDADPTGNTLLVSVTSACTEVCPYGTGDWGEAGATFNGPNAFSVNFTLPAGTSTLTFTPGAATTDSMRVSEQWTPTGGTAETRSYIFTAN